MSAPLTVRGWRRVTCALREIPSLRMSDYGGNYIIWFDWLEKTRQDKILIYTTHKKRDIKKKKYHSCKVQTI